MVEAFGVIAPTTLPHTHTHSAPRTHMRTGRVDDVEGAQEGQEALDLLLL